MTGMSIICVLAADNSFRRVRKVADAFALNVSLSTALVLTRSCSKIENLTPKCPATTKGSINPAVAT